MKLLKPVLVFSTCALLSTLGCSKPDPGAAHREKASEHLAKNEWKEAASELGLALESDPKQEKLWEEKAYAHVQLQEMPEAEAAIQKLADLKQDNAKKAELYRNLASLYLQQNNGEKAEQYFLKSVELVPQDDLSLRWLAELYAQRGGAKSMEVAAVPEALQKSAEYYDKLIALKPDAPDTYVNKRIVVAKLLEDEQKQKQALEQQAKDEKDKAKAKELTAKAEQVQGRVDALQKTYDALSQKWTQLQNAAPKK